MWWWRSESARSLGVLVREKYFNKVFRHRNNAACEREVSHRTRLFFPRVGLMVRIMCALRLTKPHLGLKFHFFSVLSYICVLRAHLHLERETRCHFCRCSTPTWFFPHICEALKHTIYFTEAKHLCAFSSCRSLKCRELKLHIQLLNNWLKSGEL